MLDVILVVGIFYAAVLIFMIYCEKMYYTQYTSEEREGQMIKLFMMGAYLVSLYIMISFFYNMYIPIPYFYF